MTFIMNMGSGMEYQSDELTFKKRLVRKPNHATADNERGALETPQLQLAMCEPSAEASNHPQSVNCIDLNVLFSEIDAELLK